MLIDVLISLNGHAAWATKSPGRFVVHLPGLRVVFAGALEHFEFLSPANGRPPVVYPQLGVNVIGVGTQGV